MLHGSKDRRRWAGLRGIAAAAAVCVLAGAMARRGLAADEVAADIPVTAAREWEEFQPFDDEMTAFMRARQIPGGTLAVSRNGKLVLARGYGWADREARERVKAASLLRIASVSKPITAVAVLRLMEQSQGRLNLDTPAVALLGYEPHLEPGREPDPRLGRISMRHLLQHTAGWDAQESFDPMFRPISIARALGVEPPAGPEAITRYMLGRPLDYEPGSKHVYSNFGYCVLGRIVEAVSGKTYEQFVRDEVLTLLGIRDMRLGRTLAEHRAEGEVRYYESGTGENVMTPEAGDEVPRPYGAFHLEAMDAHGGWIASAVDLVRFACAFDDRERCPLLRPATIDAMFARPEGEAGYEGDGTPKAAYYGLGWMVRPTADERANHWHAGRLSGTTSLLVRRHDGLNWAVLFNQSSDPSGLSYGDIDPALHRAANAVKRWPEDDLFDGYFGPTALGGPTGQRWGTQARPKEGARQT